MKYRSKAEKAAAVGLAEAIGPVEAGRHLGIPESTIRGYQKSPEFAALRAAKKEEVALDVLGAFQVGVARIIELIPETNDVQKVAIATGILFDKHQLMSGEATSRSESRTLVDDLTGDEKRRLRDWIDQLPDREPDASTGS